MAPREFLERRFDAWKQLAMATQQLGADAVDFNTKRFVMMRRQQLADHAMQRQYIWAASIAEFRNDVEFMPAKRCANFYMTDTANTQDFEKGGFSFQKMDIRIPQRIV